MEGETHWKIATGIGSVEAKLGNNRAKAIHCMSIIVNMFVV